MNHHLPCPKIIRGQEALTPEQAAYAHQFAQERIAAMLSTAPIDEREAEEHLRAVYRYRITGLEPVLVRWFDSPVAFALFSSQVGLDSVFDSVRDNVWHSTWESVWDNVQDSVKKSVRDNVQDSVKKSVRDSVWHSLENSVWDSVRDNVWHSVLAYEEACWLSPHRFFHEVFEENDLIHLALFNEMVCGYRLRSKEAWLVRKPIRLERDAQGRLHSADGMCVQFRDGWGFYAWHGIRCPEKIVLHPEQLTKEEWIHEDDLEIRRIMQERLGNDQFVELVGGKCIEQGRRADLIEVDLGDDPERVARFVRVKDASTERIYYLRVPPTFEKADAALAWTFGLEEQDYQPLQEA